MHEDTKWDIGMFGSDGAAELRKIRQERVAKQKADREKARKQREQKGERDVRPI